VEISVDVTVGQPQTLVHIEYCVQVDFLVPEMHCFVQNPAELVNLQEISCMNGAARPAMLRATLSWWSEKKHLIAAKPASLPSAHSKESVIDNRLACFVDSIVIQQSNISNKDYLSLSRSAGREWQSLG
jgi:hypothetical protein